MVEVCPGKPLAQSVAENRPGLRKHEAILHRPPLPTLKASHETMPQAWDDRRGCTDGWQTRANHRPDKGRR